MRRSQEASLKNMLEATRRSSQFLHGNLEPKPIACAKAQEPIYDIIYDDLIASGCKTVAKYFIYLVHKENELIQTDLRLKKRIRHAPCLLRAAIENMKSAERTLLTTGDKELTLKLLIQTVNMIRAQNDVYRWVVKELYAIILKICGNWDGECLQMIARTRFEYGLVLGELGGANLEEAINQLTRSLVDCKDKLWYTNEKDRSILQEDCCVELCQLLLLQAEKLSKTDPQKAAELAHQGVTTFLEVGINTDINLFSIANLREAEYTITSKNYDGALQILSGVQSTILPGEIPRNKCEFYLLLGVCNFFLAQNKHALRKLKMSLSISENCDIPDLKAKALLYCGKIHAKDRSTQAEARECFTQAKYLFRSLKDIENEKLAKYLVAKLKTYQIFPAYIELMKQASYTAFCYFFGLMKWKQNMLPFWNEDFSLRHPEDQLTCLLEEDVGKEYLMRRN